MRTHNKRSQKLTLSEGYHVVGLLGFLTHAQGVDSHHPEGVHVEGHQVPDGVLGGVALRGTTVVHVPRAVLPIPAGKDRKEKLERGKESEANQLIELLQGQLASRGAR